MGSVCKGGCRFIEGATRRGSDYYRNGNKFCMECRIAFKWEGIHCPCCGGKIRSHSRHKDGVHRMTVEVRRI